MRDCQNPPILSVVIPAYNEEANLPIVVEDCVKTLDATSLRGAYELLIVDDGSKDGSFRVAQQLAKKYRGVVAIQRPANGGIGAALRSGFEQSQGDYVSLCPGDGEIKIDEVLRLLDKVGDANLVVGQRSKCLAEPERKRPLHRRLLSGGYQLLAKVLFGLDPAKLTGLYLMKGDFLRGLKLTCNTGNLALEIYRHARRSGKTIQYAETFISPRISGSSKVTNVRTVVKTFGELVRLRLSA